ncbi:hypothetical protein DB30_03411 [Enhygromyxa salina]|uniref:Uncharacterized protein n=1 Tax=Enhygromyxa salina TaxID=215803 RepID=A0A0C1ZIJ1_9BACT|nr:hypothetical protein DB30_03411 [Enhygromyxa salina]
MSVNRRAIVGEFIAAWGRDVTPHAPAPGSAVASAGGRA